MTMRPGGFAGNPGLVTGARPGAGNSGAAAPRVTGQGPDEAVTVLYQAHYAVLVRAAALLIGDLAAAEDVVQDSFVAMHRAWWRLRDTNKALPYLRRSVINRSRSAVRHRVVTDRHPPMLVPEPPSAEEVVLAAGGQSLVLAALSALPCRQREVLVLRFYADLSEEQIAAAMGITGDAVNAHTAQARDSLRAVLGH
jgi:RNA polymerase sigma-70 factor (sigma-E family)